MITRHFLIKKINDKAFQSFISPLKNQTSQLCNRFLNHVK